MKTKSVHIALIIIAFAGILSSCIKSDRKFFDKAMLSIQTKLLIKEVEAVVPPYSTLELFTDTVYSVGPPAAPRSLREGNMFIVPSRDWTSGFFPGNLWFMYELTGDEFFMQKAEEFTARIEREKLNDMTHDMGFKINCSFGNGYRIKTNPLYREVIVQSAETLMKRFNPVVGATLSWGNIRAWGDSLTEEDHKTKWLFPVIIDNMMNLELLFLATKFTGDSTFYEVAVQHANTTLKNHFRDDNSSYHVIDYNPITGEIRNMHTHQGATHESAWARGQAWGLYGYTMCYRETGIKSYLDQAQKIAEFMLNHPNLPDDMVPYWDFNAPGIPDEPRDASAAALMASAFYELSTFIPEKSRFYKKNADKILMNLSSSYVCEPGSHFGFLLKHSTGHLPGNHEIDEPLIYADYYYLEAILRKFSL